MVEFELKPLDFWTLTYQEFWFLVIKFARSVQRKQAEIDNQLWFHGDMKAHIANFTPQIKKTNGTEWTYKDFVRLSHESDEVKEKLTLKKAKQTLGSKFNLN